MEKYSSIILKRVSRIQKCSTTIHIIASMIYVVTLLLIMTMLGVQFSHLITSSFSANLGYPIFIALTSIYILIRLTLSKICPLFNLHSLAIKIENKYPHLKTALITSVQFIKDQNISQTKLFSRILILSLFKDTADKIENISPFSGIEKKFIQYLLLAFLAVSSICAAQYIFYPTHYIETLKTIINPFNTKTAISQENKNSQTGNLIIGDITLDYTYPLYSGLKSKTIANSNGDIEALKGSFVKFYAICNKPLQKASIIIDKNTKIVLQIRESNILQGEIQLLEKGSYKIELTKNKELDPINTDSHSINIINDQYPKIRFISPKTSEKVLPVTKNDSIDMEYVCSDDFGINNISLVYRVNNDKETTISLKTFNKNQSKYQNTYHWNLNTTNLQPGDKIDYYLEIKDNDTVSGPKASTTKTLHIKIIDHNKKHKEALNQQTSLLNQMKRLLLDEIENHKKVMVTIKTNKQEPNNKVELIKSRELIYKKSQRLLSAFDITMSKMQKDTDSSYSIYYIISNIRDTFNQLIRSNISTFRLNISRNKTLSNQNSFLTVLETSYSTEIKYLQKCISLLEELLEKQALDEFLKNQDFTEQFKEKLDSLLNQFNKKMNGENDKKMTEELNKLSKMAEQAIKDLKKMTKNLKLDKIDSETNKLQNLLKKMENAIKNNNLKTALEAARELLKSLENMLENMKSLNSKFMPSPVNNYLSTINDLAEQLKELEERENKLVEKTDNLKNSIDERLNKSMENLIDDFFATQKDRLKSINEKMAETEETFNQLAANNEHKLDKTPQLGIQPSNTFIKNEINKINENNSYLSQMLDGNDVNESSKLSKEAQQNLQMLKARISRFNKNGKLENNKQVSDMTNALQSASDLNNQILSDINTFLNLAKQQKLTNLNDDDKKQIKNFSETQSKIKKETANIKTDIDDLKNKTPIIGNDIPSSMNKAISHMTLTNAKLNQSNLNGASVEERESAYNLQQTINSLNKVKDLLTKGQMPGSMNFPQFMQRGLPAGMQQGSNGMYGISVEKVEIPSENSYKVPKEFREEILNEMKGNFPQKYEPFNRNYYKELLQ